MPLGLSFLLCYREFCYIEDNQIKECIRIRRVLSSRSTKGVMFIGRGEGVNKPCNIGLEMKISIC